MNVMLTSCGLETKIIEKAGRYDRNRTACINLGNTQAVTFEENDIVVFE